MTDALHGERERTSTGTGDVTPILPGMYPDPTICRVGDDYYLANSSFEYFPGAPIFRSTDLLTWTPIGHIITRRSQFRLVTPGPSTGIYGSTLRHHDGRFWFITTNASDLAAGQVVLHADDPAGEWSDPVFVPEAQGIDPDLCWDDDGVCYLTWHVLDFVRGGQSIRQAPIDLATGRLLERPYEVWQGSGLPAAEGPHVFRRGDYWYMLLAEGGTERGHCVTVARAPSPRGPFEACPENPVLTRRSTVHPVQSVGHADVVERPDGRWAAVYLGTRPRGSTPGYHVLGRESFLAGVSWVDDWPVFDTARFDVPAASTAFDEDFRSSASPDMRWVVPDGEPDAVASATPDGLAFAGGRPLCARVRDRAWTATARATVDGEGSVSFGLRIDERHRYRVVVTGGTARAEAVIGGIRQTMGEARVNGADLELRVTASDPVKRTATFVPSGPDVITIAVSSGGATTELATLDGRYLSTEVASGFTGRMLELSGSGTGRVQRVQYRPE